MALLINNESPQNIIYNGNEVLKVIYNDVVVWEKQNEQQMYKRRIMVGDNLKGLKIFLEQYPDDFYNDLWESDGEGTTVVIECNNDDFGQTIYTYIQAEYIPSEDALNPLNGNIGIDIAYDYTIYDFDLTTTPIEVNVNSPIQIYNDSDYIVTNVKDTSVNYKCLFIEDPNIRPIQVGDIITENTMFYFVFPDNLYEDETIDWSSSVFDTTGSAGSIYMSMAHSGSDYIIYGYLGSYSMTTIYQYNNGLQSNVSYIVCGNAGTGQVDSINEILSKYILVDTTTLGE